MPLLERNALGNQKMQKFLYQQYAAKMYTICMSYTKNPADAEDILQDGFIKVFSNLEKFRGDGAFEGWLRKIISRTAISNLRKNSKNRIILQIDADNAPDDKENNIFDKLEEKEIKCMLTKLPPGYRTVFIMYAIEGYSHREIAGILGCSEGTCKSQFHRSKKYLKKII